ncbi:MULTISPECIES: hypothetical protein [Serratia]|uniref:hypothetical protein n=1 Tax=Serratia TaxID=613 RepID=UPI000AC43237|nr:hypothetical protein [Serratia sp. 506_PEND]
MDFSNVDHKVLAVEFEKSLSAFCNWGLEKDSQGKYLDKNTQYAWSEYKRIKYLNVINHRGKS